MSRIMFSESLVESTPLLRSRSRLPALVSLAVQTALVGAIIAVPMLHPEMLPSAASKLSTLAPPPNPVPPPPVTRPRVVPATSTSAPTAPSTPSQTATAMRALIHLAGNAVDEPVLAASNVTLGPANPALPTGLMPASPGVTVSPAPKPAGILRISNGVTAGLLLAPIRPDYPIIARTTGTQGTVVIQAIIARDGRIESAHVLSGPPLLQAAALDAVRSARYHPYLLNSQPTEVETTISINFRLGS
jgi:protein TonB